MKEQSAPVRPLTGVRVLALEQMQSLPVATQLLSRLGADVIKIEPPGRGEAGRQSLPAITDRAGNQVGATFLRYNLGKRSVALDITTARGVDLVTSLAQHCDVLCENLGPHRLDRLGLNYNALHRANPRLIVAALSGFGSTGNSPYAGWPAYSGVAEAMSGVYEYSRRPGELPIVAPLGGVGDTGTGLYLTIGILAALRHRDLTGTGQYVDVAMLDSMIAISDLVANFWSLGLERKPDERLRTPLINRAFDASDGWFLVLVFRRHQFERLADIVGCPEWRSDPRFDSPWGWVDHMETVIRPGIESWAADKTKIEAATILARAKIASAPGLSAIDVVHDPHVAERHMLVDIPRTDGVEQPVLVAGNPIKLSNDPEPPDGPFPLVGEHTDDVLGTLLGLGRDELVDLRSQGVIG